MSHDPIDPGPDQPPHPGEARGAPARVTVLTPGLAAALIALVVGGAYLAGPAHDESARRVIVDDSAGQARAIAFGPGGELRAATMLDGAIRVWRIGPGGAVVVATMLDRAIRLWGIDPGADRAWPLGLPVRPACAPANPAASPLTWRSRSRDP